jgi:heterodisulfide reductase subunit A
MISKTEACDTCGKCLEVCPTNAINLQEETEDTIIHVGAVILAMGFKPYDPGEMPELGYGRIPNVITSMQYERLASRSGPTEGIVRRISDGKIPKRIAWLQCIGSRDQKHQYCSSICCMYATKEAVLAKERIPDVECRIFTMDERAFNKEYNQYYLEARDEYKIKYTRCRISAIMEDPETGEVILQYPAGREHEEAAPGQGAVHEERFDMVVLAVGIQPPSGAVEIARKLGIDLNEYGFCETDKFAPLSTSRPGVFVCGAFASPKEIAETILDASGAAAEAMRIMQDHLGEHTFSRAQPFISAGGIPSELHWSSEQPSIAIALCGCSGEISNTIDLQSVARYARNIPGVKEVKIVPLACFSGGQQELLNLIRKGKGIDRLVIGACSLRTHEPLFQRLASEAGFNPYMVEMVNLREHCSWVHQSDPIGATRKASELIRAGVERVRLAEPINKEQREPVHSALVIGGGVSGMTAALTIADAGYQVNIVEKRNELGGNLHHIYYVAEGENPQRLLRDLVNRVVSHNRINVYLNSQVIKHTGSVGDFRAIVQESDGQIELRHSVTILATGGAETGGDRYLLGQDPRIIKQSELEEILAHQPDRASRLRSVVLIQCVQPEGHAEYCSRICCTNTLKNAIRLKMLNPDCQVVLLYKDIITYGFREKYYLEARRRGVIFVRYTDSDPPEVYLEPSGARMKCIVSVNEHIFGKKLTFEPDLVALSMSIRPSHGTRELAEMLGIPLSPEGFYREAHLKMRPMDFADDGIFLAGMAHYPKFIEESITHALAAAGRALTILSRPTIQLGGIVAEIDENKCTACLTCVRTCPFGIPEVRDDFTGVGGIVGAAWIDPARCQGCGTCTAECPARAIQLKHYLDEQISVAIGAWDAPLPQPAGD